MADLTPIIVTAASALATVLVGFLTSLYRRLTRAEINRVELSVGSDRLQMTGANLRDQQAVIERFVQRINDESDQIPKDVKERLVEDVKNLEDASILDEHTRLVFKYYAQGVGQAQVSFYFSLAFASVGFMVIIAGVVLAIVRPGNAVQTAVTVGAGVITDAIGALFFTLANRSRAVMTSFIDKLRMDREREREFLKSLELIEIIENVQLKDSLKSIAALRFLRAETNIRSLPGFPSNSVLKLVPEDEVNRQSTKHGGASHRKASSDVAEA